MLVMIYEQAMLMIKVNALECLQSLSAGSILRCYRDCWRQVSLLIVFVLGSCSLLLSLFLGSELFLDHALAFLLR